MKGKKLKLTRLTVANLNRVRSGGDIHCFCVIYPGGGGDEACNENGYPSITASLVKSQCGICPG